MEVPLIISGSVGFGLGAIIGAIFDVAKWAYIIPSISDWHAESPQRIGFPLLI